VGEAGWHTGARGTYPRVLGSAATWQALVAGVPRQLTASSRQTDPAKAQSLATRPIRITGVPRLRAARSKETYAAAATIVLGTGAPGWYAARVVAAGGPGATLLIGVAAFAETQARHAAARVAYSVAATIRILGTGIPLVAAAFSANVAGARAARLRTKPAVFTGVEALARIPLSRAESGAALSIIGAGLAATQALSNDRRCRGSG